MNLEITGTCRGCSTPFSAAGFSELCGPCKKPLFPFHIDDFSQCPACGCKDLYRQKDFNRNIGVFILIIGAVFAYWTYGISLFVVALIDFWIFRSIKDVGICYLCQTQYRGGDFMKHLVDFNLVLHDHYLMKRQYQ